MKKCDDIQFLLTLYALDNLGSISKQEVSKHLKECKKCQKEFNEIKQGLTLINDVLEDTSVDDQHLSKERYDAIIKASHKKTIGLGWITKHRPALGIAASTLVVFGLTWAIVSSMQAPKYESNKNEVDSTVEDTGIYCTPSLGAKGAAMQSATKKTTPKPAKSMISLPEHSLPDYGHADGNIQDDLKRDNKPQSTEVEETDAATLIKSPVVPRGIHGSRDQLMSVPSTQLIEIEKQAVRKGSSSRRSREVRKKEKLCEEIEVASELLVDEDNADLVGDKMVNQQTTTSAVIKGLQGTLPTHGKHIQFRRDLQITPESKLNVEFKVQKLNIGGHLMQIVSLLVLAGCIWLASLIFKRK